MKVIIAIDQSAYWRQVVKVAGERHWPKGTVFKVLTVIHPFQWEHFNTPGWEKSAHDIREARCQTAQKILAEAQRTLAASQPDTTVQTELEHGNPAEHILKAATDWPADKIVLGAHHHSPTGAFGAVPRAVISRAPCSVELVRLTRLSAAEIEKQIEHQVEGVR